jgi:hypothetical protein
MGKRPGYLFFKRRHAMTRLGGMKKRASPIIREMQLKTH